MIFHIKERLVVARINAMTVWNNICRSKWCEEAHSFYTNRNISKEIVLQRGAANFDELLGKIGEKPWYRAAYYVGNNGYMDMHLYQNQATFHKHSLINTLKNRRAVFVDFGCGPMTSGVVLAEELSATMTDYKDRVLYIGIDASENMCGIATLVNRIEEGHCLLDRFIIIHQNFLAPQQIDQIIKEHFQPEIAVLFLSFVLADETFKEGSKNAEALAHNWQKILQQFHECRETLIIYLNPEFPGAHNNWTYMVRNFLNHSSGDWNYRTTNLQSIPVQTLSRNVVTQMISGKKRT